MGVRGLGNKQVLYQLIVLAVLIILNVAKNSSGANTTTKAVVPTQSEVTTQ